MTAATETGHIVAYLSLDDTEWARSIRRAIADLERLRSQRDIDLRVRLDDNGALAALQAIRSELSSLRRMDRTNLNIRTNARQVGSEMQSARRQTNLLVDSIMLLGSAAVPVGAVAAGAIGGLLPVAVATIAGIAGIRDMMKSGAIDSTQYAGDINSVKSELTTLKAVTAVPLLEGLHQGMADADPLFKTINTDAHQMAGQIGTIASNAVPALLNVLTQMAPLFTTIGNELVHGSEGFLRWTKSSDGVRDFVSYVQSELPAVEHTLGSLIQLVGRIAQGLGPVGHLTLTSIGVLADAINSLPLPVLQMLLPLIIATRVAMLAYRGVSAVMTGVNAAYTRTAGTAQVFGSTTMAANLQASASATAAAAETAAAANVTAQANLRNATTAVTAAEAQVTAAATGSVAQRSAAAAALTSATTQQTSAARTAAVTQAAAVRAAGAAEASAVRTVAAGRVAATGWTAALGPIGALVLGLSLLGMAFMGSSDESKTATDAQQNYTESVKQSVDALNRANVQATVKTLSDNGQYAALAKLTKGNADLTLTQNDLTNAVNGNQKAFDSAETSLKAFAETQLLPSKAGVKRYNDEGKAALSLADDLGTARDALQQKLAAQKLEVDAQRAATELYLGGATAAGQQAAALGLTRDAYLDAAGAARKNAEQTAAQTAAYQAANDAASLFKQTLDLLNGKNLDVATAKTNAAASYLRTAAAIKENGSAIKGNSAAAIANKQAIQQAVQQAQAYGDAVGKSTGSSDKAVAAYKRSKTAFEDQLRATGKLTPAMQRYIDKLFAIKDVKVPPTKIDVDARAAKSNLAAVQKKIDNTKQLKAAGIDVDTAYGKSLLGRMQAAINGLRQGRKPTIDAETAAALTKLGLLQSAIDNMHGKRVYTDVVTRTHHDSYSGADSSQQGKGPIAKREGGLIRRAAGGPVVGPGTGTSDQVAAVMVDGSVRQPYMLSNGEWIATAEATKKNRGPLAAANRGATLAVVHEMATGGAVGNSGISKTGTGKSATFSYGSTKYDTLTQAQNARSKDIKANVKLIAQIDTTGLKKFEKALHGTEEQGKAAFRAIYADMKKAGASDGLLRGLRNMNAQLDKTLKHRDQLRTQLGTPTSTTQTAYEKLEQVQSDRASLSGSVSDTARGSFDVTSAGGSEVNGRQTSSFGAAQASGLQAANLVEQFYAGIRQLGGGVLGQSDTGRQMLRQLIEKGPGAYPQVASLLQQTPSNVSSLVATQQRIDTASAALGAYAGTTFYGGDETKARNAVTKLRSDIAADDRKADRQGDRIANKIDKAITGWKVEMDGKAVGKLVNTGNNKNKRRN